MKIALRVKSGSKAPQDAARSARAGSALMIVLVLLSLMAAMMVSNAVALRRLKVELRLLDQKQQQRISQTQTNAPPNHLPEGQAAP
jgi:hypothetical protein